MTVTATGQGAGVAVTRQIVLPTSSATSRAPRVSIATPTGRPLASPLSFTKPVRTSTSGPDGAPFANGTNTTLYPLRGLRFHDPCWPTNMPRANRGGSAFGADQARPNDAVCGP